MGGAVRGTALGRAQPEESGDVSAGTDPGAPVLHRIARKLMWTTVFASAVFAILWAIYAAGLIPFDFLMAISGPPRRY